MSQAGPRTVADWLPLLDRFASGDDSALDEMQRGRLVLSPGPTPGGPSAPSRTLQRRLGLFTARLGRRLDLATSAGDVSAVLGWLRAELIPLQRFSNLPGFALSTQAELDAACRGWVQQTQRWLEHEAWSVEDEELLVLTIRRSPLRWPPSRRQSMPAQTPTPDDGGQPPRRNVLGLPDG